LSEANITIFAKTTSNRALKYCLDNYLGLVKKQIDRAKKLNSRARRIIRGYPMIFLAKKQEAGCRPTLTRRWGGGWVVWGIQPFLGYFSESNCQIKRWTRGFMELNGQNAKF
jgi:hypothetical protein